jgi:uncharacterized protein YdaT
MPKNAHAQRVKYTKDQFGKDILLKDDSLQVMMEWEKPYMEACIDALKPKGDVLEIGFGMGYSAEQIQKYHPKSHTIVESEPLVASKAKEWAKRHSNVTIVEGMWQEVLPKLGVYDAIFFDDYTPYSEEEVKRLQRETSQFEQVAKEAKGVQDELKAILKNSKEIKFSDQDLLQFAHQVASRPGVSTDYILKFINNMREWGHITEKQRDLFEKELEKASKGQLQKKPYSWQTPRQFPGDRFITFAQECLDMHMHAGSRLSAYMGNPESKTKHPQFQTSILSRKDVKFSEKTIKVDVPSNCQYYRGNEALVIVIEKK